MAVCGAASGAGAAPDAAPVFGPPAPAAPADPPAQSPVQRDWQLTLPAEGARYQDVFEAAAEDNPLQAFHPNYFVLASDHGETKFQFLVSIDYRLIDTRWPAQALRDAGRLFGLDAGAVPDHLGPLEWPVLSFAYDGLYDFHFFSPVSTPVVSRLQNPGVFVKLARRGAQYGDGIGPLGFGWFHESDGQTITTPAAYNELYGQVGQDAKDSIARGWDYWYLSQKFSFHQGGDAEPEGVSQATQAHNLWSVMPVLRIYTGSQGFVNPVRQDTWWLPQNPEPRIDDYDGIRALFSWKRVFPDTGFFRWRLVQATAEFRTGYDGGLRGNLMRNWSRRFTLTNTFGYLPVYLYYDNGYGPYISDYTTFSQGWGVGIRLW